MTTLFLSYSHNDEDLRNELEVHLSMLKRDGLIDVWHDRRIEAGTELHDEISAALENADVVLLLVSAYFLDSDYCYDVEMKRALERHGAGDAKVIPVILHPCDWQNSLFGNLRATPTDGKPISMHANIHEALTIVTRDVRQAVSSNSTATTPAKPRPKESGQLNRVEPVERSSNLRVKKEFSDIDVDTYLDESFDYIARYFEGSLRELEARNAGVRTRYKRVDANRFTAAVYNEGNRGAECTVWLSARDQLFSGIAYFSGITESANQYHECMSVSNDGYILSLKPFGMSYRGTNSEVTLSQQGAAEFYWSMLIKNLQ